MDGWKGRTGSIFIAINVSTRYQKQICQYILLNSFVNVFYGGRYILRLMHMDTSCSHNDLNPKPLQHQAPGSEWQKHFISIFVSFFRNLVKIWTITIYKGIVHSAVYLYICWVSTSSIYTIGIYLITLSGKYIDRLRQSTPVAPITWQQSHHP